MKTTIKLDKDIHEKIQLMKDKYSTISGKHLSWDKFFEMLIEDSVLILVRRYNQSDPAVTTKTAIKFFAKTDIRNEIKDISEKMAQVNSIYKELIKDETERTKMFYTATLFGLGFINLCNHNPEIWRYIGKRVPDWINSSPLDFNSAIKDVKKKHKRYSVYDYDTKQMKEQMKELREITEYGVREIKELLKPFADTTFRHLKREYDLFDWEHGYDWEKKNFDAIKKDVYHLTGYDMHILSPENIKAQMEKMDEWNKNQERKFKKKTAKAKK